MGMRLFLRKISLVSIGVAVILSNASCSKQWSDLASPVINPASLCVVDSFEQSAVSQACTAGQKVAFLPNRWGNEQLPIMFAAVNCDLRYSVVTNNGGVTCIYLPATKVESTVSQAN